jgi:hypothetical protein
MKLRSDAVQRRHRIRAAVFALAMLAALAVAWYGWGRRRPFPVLLFALPLAGLVYGRPAVRSAWRWCRWLAARSLASAILIGSLAVAVNAAISLLIRMPEPKIHDEFSYLLAADTFAHGRLANPTHPMWVHFEAPHVIHQPTYASKYPPAQGLVMALGQAALGLPIAGVWLSAGLACGALTWMLAGWMPGRWALAGGLVAVAHPQMIAWGQRYWGGLVAVAGGALVVGAFRRLVRRPRARHAVALGVGLGILANSRPFEGLVLSLPFLVALGVWLLGRQGPAVRAALFRVLLPAGGVLAIVGAAMLHYNYRVTGDALTMPYMVHERTYGTTALFRFQEPRPIPAYRHERLRGFYTDGGIQPRTELTLAALVRGAWSRVDSLDSAFFLVPGAAVAVGILLPLERAGWHHFAILGLGLFVLACGAETWLLDHYVAPVVGLALLVTLQAVRRVGAWRPTGRRLGPPLIHALVLFVMVTLAVQSWRMVRWVDAAWHLERARIAAELGRSGQRHLMIVRYVPTYPIKSEWVYNSADIDAAPVVWAREMDAESTARLLDYFRDRQAWLLEPDHHGVRRTPYPRPHEPAAPPRAGPASSGG